MNAWSTRATSTSIMRLEALGERAVPLFDKPDAGIWEFRGTERRHTFSAAMCWAACDRLARIAAAAAAGGALRLLARRADTHAGTRS